MSYYKTCPRCGAHLDPGETCDCKMPITQAVAFPSKAVRAVAVENRNGTFSIYTNALLSASEQAEAAAELAGRKELRA